MTMMTRIWKNKSLLQKKVMKHVLFGALVVLAFTLTTSADPILPSFPLSNPYALNFTYDTFFFNPTVQTNLTGLSHFLIPIAVYGQ